MYLFMNNHLCIYLLEKITDALYKNPSLIEVGIRVLEKKVVEKEEKKK